MRRSRGAVAAVTSVLALALAGAVWLASRDRPIREARIPELSFVGRAGKELFDRHCAQCHGPAAVGTAAGPPLVHAVYRPGHHGDVAFELAVRRGVRAHHWSFGDMPALPAVTSAEVTQITRYVRELQAANGIL